MSGGHFDFKQYEIGRIADEVEQLIYNNNKPDELGFCNNFSEETLDHFRQGIKLLKAAEVYAQRIDWLVSGDDGENTFHERLIDDLNRLEREI